METRQRPEFSFLQATRTPPRADASESERLEWWLLSLTDEEYESLQVAPKINIRDDAPSTTGDKLGDQWEREFWASRGE